MYGLLEAASQIKATGRLTAAKAIAATRIRGVRISLQPADTQAEWFRSRTYWDDSFAAMARNAGSVTDFFRIPTNRVVELGTRVEI